MDGSCWAGCGGKGFAQYDSRSLLHLHCRHPWTFPLAIALSLALWPPVQCITPVTRRPQALMEPLPSAPDSTSARVSACLCLMAVLPTAQCVATAATHSRAWLHPQHIAHSCGRWLASPPGSTSHPPYESILCVARVNCSGRNIFKLFLQRSASMPDATCMFILVVNNLAVALWLLAGSQLLLLPPAAARTAR